MRELDTDTLMFFDQHMDILPLYQAFEELLSDSFSVVNKRVQKTQITHCLGSYEAITHKEDQRI